MASPSAWIKSIAATSIRMPSPPTQPLDSTGPALTYRKGAQRSNKGSAKYPLVSELNEFIENGLKTLDYGALATSSELPVARLEIFREAFVRFIDEFNIYRPFLLDVKREYDAVIEALWDKYNDTMHIRSHLASVEKAHLLSNQELENSHKQILTGMKAEITRLELKLEAKTKECSACFEECSKLRAIAKSTTSENDELSRSCSVLTKSLVRMEEERKQLMVKDASRAAEVVAAGVSTQRAIDEAERLRQTISDMEAEHATFVSPDVHEKLVETLESSQQEFRQLEAAHKQLIIRYTTLKTALEQASKSVDGRSTTTSLSQRLQQNIITDGSMKLQSALDIDQLDVNMARSIGDSRLVIEVLLDQIEMLRSQVRHLQIEAGQLLTNSSTSGKGLKDDGNDSIGDFQTPWNHFQGLGNHDSVPTYLRTTGKVQNLCLSKRDVARLIDEFWVFVRSYRSKEKSDDAKVAREKELARQAAAMDPLVVAMSNLIDEFVSPMSASVTSNDPNALPTVAAGPLGAPPLSSESFMPFPELFNMFLEGKCKSRILAVELAYNWVDALKKYNNNCDFKLFLAILNEEISEDAWQEQSSMLANIKEEMVREQLLRAAPGADVKKISPEAFVRVLKKCCPTKPEHAFSRLQKALVLCTKSSREVDYVELLLDSETGFKGKFCDLLCQQFTNECVNFTRRVISCVNQLRETSGTLELQNTTPLENIAGMVNSLASNVCLAPISKIRDALEVADPNRSRSEINRVVARGCGMTVEDALLLEARMVVVPVDEFCTRLRRKGVLRPTGGKSRTEA